MKIVRIRKRLDAPIPQLPELTSMVGKDVEITVVEESGPSAHGNGAGHSEVEIWTGAASVEPATGLAVERRASFDELIGGWPEDQLNDGFEEEVDRLRSVPWRQLDTGEATSPVTEK